MINDFTVLPIDAVITWVDGNDPAHQAKLEAYFGKKWKVGLLALTLVAFTIPEK